METNNSATKECKTPNVEVVNTLGTSAPLADAAAAAAAAAAVAAKTLSKEEKKRVRCKKVLKASVIRRICQLPEVQKKIRRCIRRNARNAMKCPAEVHYTNSQFGQPSIPCVESGCNSCALAPTVTKRLPSPVKKGTKTKTKRLCCECKAANPNSNVSIFMKPKATQGPSIKEYHCMCTEFNGKLYKLMGDPLHRFSTKRGLIKRLLPKRKVTKRAAPLRILDSTNF